MTDKLVDLYQTEMVSTTWLRIDELFFMMKDAFQFDSFVTLVASKPPKPEPPRKSVKTVMGKTERAPPMAKAGESQNSKRIHSFN